MRIAFVIVFIFLLISWSSRVKRMLYRNDTINIQQQNEILKDTQPTNEKDTEEFFGCILYSVPSFDAKEWREYLMNNMPLDPGATDTIPPGNYTANIQFVINSEGKIAEVLIKSDPGYGLGKRAMEIISKYKGQCQWTASPYGRQLKSYRVQPVTFIIEEADECEEELSEQVIL